MRLRLGAVLVGLSILASGCSGGGEAPAAASTSSAPPPTVTAETGSIEGRIVDEEAMPVPNVRVALVELAAEQQSDAEGKFVFNNLTAGSYRLITERLGYESVARSVEVKVGEVASLSLTMEALQISVEPFVQLLPFKGLIQCSYNPLYAVNACGGVTGEDKDQFLFTVDTNFTLKEAVVELIWTPSSSATAQQLELDVCDHLQRQETICFEHEYYKYQTDPSPNVLRLTDLPLKKQATFMVGVGAGLDEPTPVFQQEFDLFVSLCYVEECAAEYSAVPK